MFPMETAFLKLLSNHLTYDNTIIPFVKNYAEVDRTPCFTINQADERFIRRRYVQIDGAEYLRKRYNSDIWINIWCNDEKQRHTLMKQINHRILQAESNHYSTCSHYKDDSCELLESTCEALTHNTGRTGKQQCPNLDNYQSFFQKHHIIKNTFRIESVTDLDELDPTGQILRTIFKLNMDYYHYHKIGGAPFDEFELETTI